MNNEMQIIIRKVRLMKKKDGSSINTIVSYSTGYSESNNERGENLVDSWFEGSKVFEALTKEYINVPLSATYELIERYDGTLRRQLKDIFDEDGCTILN